MHQQTILVTGGTGFIGQSLVPALLEEGYQVLLYVRNTAKAVNMFGEQVRCVTSFPQIHSDTPIDGVINLAGESIVGGVWTEARRKKLRDSRLSVTQGLIELFDRLEQKPEFLISGSAIGYYGTSDTMIFTEKDVAGDDFSATLCQDWEELALKAENHQMRVVRLRTGVVFGADGGAFPQMTLPIKLGMGAVIGSGQQWISWIHKQDLIRIIGVLMTNKKISGAVNATAPVPIRQKEFVKFVARHCRRPQFIKLPAFVLEKTIGELSSLFVKGQFVRPMKLAEMEFEFYYPRIEMALENLLP